MTNLMLILITLIIVGLIVKLFKQKKAPLKADNSPEQHAQEPGFPKFWSAILNDHVLFYRQLDEEDRKMFEMRVEHFLAEKTIEGVETEIDDSIRLMVASSAIIPTFAFPGYNYPHISTVLIYPDSFDENFEIRKLDGKNQQIIGMVGNHSLKGMIILSKPDLEKAFDGKPHKSHVGIHEFVHLLDKEDGEIDGIPERLLENSYVGPWLSEIKKAIRSIEKGTSDINPYALTNNAEFLAVVSEYFFSNPIKFEKRHPDLYHFLSAIYDTVDEEEQQKPN